MQKKGSLMFIKNDRIKALYCHRSAQMEVFGRDIVTMIKHFSREELDALYDYIEMVDEDEPMTPEQIQAYKKYMPAELWKPDLNWTTALRYTLNPIVPLVDGFPYVVDYAGFLPSWRNRYRYVIDLDNNEFRVAKAGLEIISQLFDEFSPDGDYCDSIASTVLGRWPLDNIPEDWLEQIKATWSKYMIKAVPMDELCLAGNEVDSDYQAQRTASRFQYYLGV